MPVILSNKSDDEIRWMLDDYGIKHGPVVGKGMQPNFSILRCRRLYALMEGFVLI